MEDREIIQQLQQASEGLLWLSESDYPFEVIYWQEKKLIIEEKILQNRNNNLAKTIETKTLESFFEFATKEQDWHDRAEKEEVDRYQNLVKILQDKLTDIKVYRVGKFEVDVYILGTTESGAICGLSTKVIET